MSGEIVLASGSPLGVLDVINRGGPRRRGISHRHSGISCHTD